MRRKSTNILLGGWLAAFLVFIVLSLYAGGCAMGGKLEGGHYYLGDTGKRNKAYTEVSRGGFVASAAFTAIWPLIFLVVLLRAFWRELSLLLLVPPICLFVVIPTVIAFGIAFISLRCLIRALAGR